MLVAYVLYPVKVLGPGERIGIWLYGCNRRCKGCATPQLQEFRQEKEISVDRLCEMVFSVLDKYPVDGITISGGEPMEQAEELQEFLKKISPRIDDILLYTGYTLEQLLERNPKTIQDIQKYVTVLIEGEYIEDENKGHVLRGSDNQKIHYKNQDVKEKYERYITESGQRKCLQTFQVSDGIFTVGIPEKGFRERLESRLNL